MRKRLITCILLLAAGCSLFQPPPELTWDHDPDTIIIKVTVGGGLQPTAAAFNAIPRAIVWGDGRIIWQTHDDAYNRLVWQGQLNEEEMASLLQTFADKGFFRMDNHYAPKEPVYDSSSTSLRLNLLAGPYSVSEYHDGAPRAFHELVGLVSSGAGAEGQPYIPGNGYLTAVSLQNGDPTGLPIWDADTMGLNLDDAHETLVEGETLARAWEIVNQKEWSPLVIQGDDVYELHLQIPELTGG